MDTEMSRSKSPPKVRKKDMALGLSQLMLTIRCPKLVDKSPIQQ